MRWAFDISVEKNNNTNALSLRKQHEKLVVGLANTVACLQLVTSETQGALLAEPATHKEDFALRS